MSRSLSAFGVPQQPNLALNGCSGCCTSVATPILLVQSQAHSVTGCAVKEIAGIKIMKDLCEPICPPYPPMLLHACTCRHRVQLPECALTLGVPDCGSFLDHCRCGRVHAGGSARRYIRVQFHDVPCHMWHLRRMKKLSLTHINS